MNYFETFMVFFLESGFLWSRDKFTKLVGRSKDKVRKWLPHLRQVVMGGVMQGTTKVRKFAIATWPPGGLREGQLITFVVTIEYILGKGSVPDDTTDYSQLWQDTIPYAVHPNAKTMEERYDRNYSEEQLEGGRQVFRDILSHHYTTSSQPTVLLVDSNDVLFGNLRRPQMIACEIGYEYIGESHGGELIGFKANKVLLLMYGHPSIAGDSRPAIRVGVKQERATTIDAVAHLMRIAEGKAVDESTLDPRAILGSLYAEKSDHGLHGNIYVGAAIFRDMVTPDNINALDTYGGKLTPAGVLDHPGSKYARLKNGNLDDNAGLRKTTNYFSSADLSDDDMIEKTIAKMISTYEHKPRKLAFVKSYYPEGSVMNEIIERWSLRTQTTINNWNGWDENMGRIIRSSENEQRNMRNRNGQRVMYIWVLKSGKSYIGELTLYGYPVVLKTRVMLSGKKRNVNKGEAASKFWGKSEIQLCFTVAAGVKCYRTTLNEEEVANMNVPTLDHDELELVRVLFID